MAIFELKIETPTIQMRKRKKNHALQPRLDHFYLSCVYYMPVRSRNSLEYCMKRRRKKKDNSIRLFRPANASSNAQYFMKTPAKQENKFAFPPFQSSVNVQQEPNAKRTNKKTTTTDPSRSKIVIYMLRTLPPGSLCGWMTKTNHSP